MSNENFLGRGMKFPPQIDAGTGRFALSSGALGDDPSSAGAARSVPAK